MVIDLILELFDDKIILFVMAYSYLLYILFLNSEQFYVPKNLEEIFKISSIFLVMLMLYIPLVTMPHIEDFLLNESLSSPKEYETSDLGITLLFLIAIPWVLKIFKQRFNLKKWFSYLSYFSIILLTISIISITIDKFSLVSQTAPQFIGRSIAVFILILIGFFFNKTFTQSIPNLKDNLRGLKYNKSLNGNNNTNKNMKRIRIWDKEDSHLFGELFIIVAGVFVYSGLNTFLIRRFPNINPWWFIVMGFVILWIGIKIIRKSE